MRRKKEKRGVRDRKGEWEKREGEMCTSKVSNQEDIDES